LKVRIGVIPAAGKGKRMGFSSGSPKSLLSVCGNPIIYYIIQNMKRIGIEKIYVIVNFQREKIIKYLNRVKDGTPEIFFVHQKKLLGIADAIGLTEQYCNEPFMTILGDDFTQTESLQNIVDIFARNDAIAVESVVKENNLDVLTSTCCVELDEMNRITRIEEKPKQPFSNLRGCGIYVFNPSIFYYIKQTPRSPLRGEFDITDTLSLVSKTGKCYGELINGINININTAEDLAEAKEIIKNSGKRRK
jgi:dTDP-glucose pyrophosphorylase